MPTDPFTGMFPARPLTPDETLQAVRGGIASESDALNFYQAHLATVEDPMVRSVLTRILDDEREHLAWLTGVLETLDGAQGEHMGRRFVPPSPLAPTPGLTPPPAVLELDHAIASLDQAVVSFPQAILANPEFAAVEPMVAAAGRHIPQDEQHPWVKNVIWYYGVTEDPNLAGFLTPAGHYIEMFSEDGLYAPSEHSHNDVGIVIDYYGEDPETAFIAQTGSIRMIYTPENRELAIMLAAAPTDAQRRRLFSLIEQTDHLAVDAVSPQTLEIIYAEQAESPSVIDLNRLITEAVAAIEQQASPCAAASSGVDGALVSPQAGYDTAPMLANPQAYEPDGRGENVRAAEAAVVDLNLARTTPCHRLTFSDGRTAVYSPGIIGPLDEEMQALYCQMGTEDKEATPDQLARLQALAEPATLSRDVPSDPAKRLDAYLARYTEVDHD